MATSWVSSLFSKTTTDEETPIKQPAQSTAKPKVAAAPVIATVPASAVITKLPLDVLKRLAPIRDLSDNEIGKIEQCLLTYKKNSTVFALGEKNEQILYLLKGSIEFKPDGDASYVISEGTSLANLPLNSGKVCGATAVTISPATILSIPMSIAHWWANKSRAQNQTKDVQLITELPDQIPHTPFFNAFADAYRKNKLSLPSLPKVAIQLRKVMEKEGVNIRDVIAIVQVDAPIVAKLIQVANGALYAPTTPITNCHDAVTRLGLDTTRKLVMGIGAKQLFKTNSPQLMSQMQALWKKSLHVSSLSFVLAQESGVVDPEDALLAGLVCDIGAIPLINFAEQHPEEHPVAKELQDAIHYLNPPVGSLVLHTLGFPHEIAEIPKYAEDWFHESGGDKLTLIDVVILAKLHSYIGTDRAKELPYVNSVPAYTKLKNGKLNHDFSLDILAKAQKRIDAAMRMFA
jgi:HD-like signal output (HDOD) protein